VLRTAHPKFSKQEIAIALSSTCAQVVGLFVLSVISSSLQRRLLFCEMCGVFEKNLILLDISPELLYFSSAFGLL
jgi:hypothetical protein